MLWTLKLQNPTKHSHLYLAQDLVDMDKLSELESEHIAEWYINETENIVVVKYVSEALEADDIKAKISK